MNLAMPEDRPRLQSSFLNRSQSELRAVMERENEINKSRGGPKFKHYVDLHERRIASMAKEQKRREHEGWAFSRSSIWQHGHVEHLPGGASGSTVGSSPGLGPAHDGGELDKGETNLFSNETAAPRETVLRPKSEATSFYENRPWTPTTGEDYLLAAPKGFHPSSSLYPRRQGKAQKFVGARRAAYYIDEQPPKSQSSPLRLKPMAIQPFCDNGFISMQESRQARAEILIKDHKRGVMTEYPALKDPSFSFASLALTLETEILEFTSDAARTDELRPSLAVTNKSLEMLDRIADFPGPFQKILLYVRETLQDAIFASTDALNSEKSSPRSISRTTSDRDSSRQESKPYFWLFQKTSAELKKIKQDRSSPENEKLEAESDDAQAMSPDATLSSKKSNHEPKKDTSVEEKYAEKIRALQNEKLGMEEIMQELALQNNTYIWDLEEKSSENTKLYQEAAQLKASFLRIKSDCMDARAEAAFVNTLNERNFHQLQSSITRSEHERVVQEYEGQLAAQHEKFSRMMEEHHGDGGKKVADAMKTMTPRPTWRRTGLSKQILVDSSVFPRTMSSAESVDKLLQGFASLQTNFTNLKVKLAELEGAEEKVADESHSWGGMKVTNSIITCMGLSEDVPEFLRFSGQVRNLKMRKGDAEKWVRTIWAAKAEIDTARKDAGNDERLDLATFFRNWVIKKFNDHEVKMAEWTYNLIVTVRGNCHDTDLDLFLKILLKEISEDVYHDEKDQMEDAMILAKQVDMAENNGKVTARVKKAAFLQRVQHHFTKSFDQMQNLKSALDAAFGSKAEKFNYRELFDDDRDFSQNEFAEEFRSQAMKDRDAHIEKLKKMVHEMRSTDGNDPNMLRLDDFGSALRMLEPALDTSTLDSKVKTYLHRGCKVPENRSLPKTIDADEFLHNLLTLGVCKPGSLGRLEWKKSDDLLKEVISSLAGS